MSNGRTPLERPSWLALDVGGANLKAAHSTGMVRSSPFAVWKEPEKLGRSVAALAAEFPAFDRVAVTMTAELCDCFETKSEGVARIVEALREGLQGIPIHYWGTDGRFHEERRILETPLLAAASNWLATATVAARFFAAARAILIDVGSTTTDLIPLVNGRVAARGRTDLERLRSGELVYAGVSRTPVCALAVELPFRGRPTGLAAEFFATTRDVYTALGDIPPDAGDSATADGRPATMQRSIERLARMVCSDREECIEREVLGLARAADAALVSRLVKAARRACEEAGGIPTVAVVCGSGEFLARRVAEAIIGPSGTIRALGEHWGRGPSEAACARALLELVSEWEEGTAANV